MSCFESYNTLSLYEKKIKLDRRNATMAIFTARGILKELFPRNKQLQFCPQGAREYLEWCRQITTLGPKGLKFESLSYCGLNGKHLYRESGAFGGVSTCNGGDKNLKVTPRRSSQNCQQWHTHRHRKFIRTQRSDKNAFFLSLKPVEMLII